MFFVYKYLKYFFFIRDVLRKSNSIGLNLGLIICSEPPPPFNPVNGGVESIGTGNIVILGDPPPPQSWTSHADGPLYKHNK